MTSFEKKASELNIVFNSYSYDGEDTRLNFTVYNHYNQPCSFKNAGGEYNLQYSLDGKQSWSDATLGVVQPEPDLKDMPVNGKGVTIEIDWRSAIDLHVLHGFNNVWMRIKMNDRPNHGGTFTDWYEFLLAEVDQSPDGNIILEKPYPNDATFLFEFRNLISEARQVNVHYKIEMDTVETFDSENYKTWDSSAVQTDWTVDGGAFPVDGAPTEVEEIDAQVIKLDKSEFSEYTNTIWFFRVTPSLHDPDGELNPTYWDSQEGIFREF